MKTLILLEKRTYLLKLISLFKQKNELSIKEIKQKIPSATYYTILLHKLVDINNILSNNRPGYFIRPVFLKQNNKVVSGLKKHPDIQIKVKDGFVVLCYDKD